MRKHVHMHARTHAQKTKDNASTHITPAVAKKISAIFQKCFVSEN